MISAICLISFGLILVGAGLTFNGLISAKNAVKNAFTQIDVQLKRRHDLVPNLIAAVKGYMAHESEVLEKLTKARTLAQEASSSSDRIEQEKGLSQAIGKVMMVAESYPDLKASQNFQALQEELVSTENRIAFARQFYNDCVMAYDTCRQGFPGMLLAGNARFADEPYWKIDAAEQRDPIKVEF